MSKYLKSLCLTVVMLFSMMITGCQNEVEIVEINDVEYTIIIDELEWTMIDKHYVITGADNYDAPALRTLIEDFILENMSHFEKEKMRLERAIISLDMRRFFIERVSI